MARTESVALRPARDLRGLIMAAYRSMVPRMRVRRSSGSWSARGVRSAMLAWCCPTTSSHSVSEMNNRSSSAWLSSGWVLMASCCTAVGRSRCIASSSCKLVMPMFIVSAARTKLSRSRCESCNSCAMMWHSVPHTSACDAL
ncbi:hypothetical protein D3C71_1549050 [compost metagenome]